MKRFILFFFFWLPLLLAAQPQLSWRFANPRILRVSGLDRLEFDVQVKASEAGTLFWSGQFNLTFNNSAFSTVAADVTTVRAGISAQMSDISSDFKYAITRTVTGASPNLVINVALTPADISILGELPSAESSAEITTAWQTFIKLRLRLSDATAIAGIGFVQGSMNGQQAYHSGAGSYTYYQNPNLFVSPDLQMLQAGRVFSSMGWSQAGGSVNNVQHTDWTTAVNTSVWEGQPLLDGGAFLMNKLTIHSGAVLTVSDDASLTVSSDLMNQTGNTGLVLQSSAASTASLVHSSHDTPATVQRYISGSSNLTDMSYHLVSVPVSSGAVSGWWLDSYLYRFDAPGQTWVSMGTSTTTPLSVDQGYMVYYPGIEHTYSFSGPLLNGIVPLSVGFFEAGGFSGLNLVPNPYPSAIDWNSVTGWTKTNVSNAFWIWNPVAGNYASFGAYGTLNATQFIPQGQAFFVKATADSPVLSVNNNARLHNSQAFFKNSDPPGLLRFKALANGMEDEMIIVFDPSASAAYNPQQDVAKLFGSGSAPQLFSATQQESLALTINALNLPAEGVSLPISLQLEVDGQLTLEFVNVATFDPAFELLLEDLLTGQVYDLRSTPSLLLDHLPSNPSDRFVLHVVKVTALPFVDAGCCKIWSMDDAVLFTHPSAHGSRLEVCITDMAGRLIVSKTCFNSSLNSLKVPGFTGLLVVSVKNNQNNSTKKIFLKPAI